jgi:hypothetical protein
MVMITGTQTIAVYEMVEIRAILGSEVAIAITVAPQATELPTGMVMGQITADKLYDPYNNANNDGTEKAKVILGEPVPASEEPLVATAYIKGIFYQDKLTGLDANAMTDLFARELDGLIII